MHTLRKLPAHSAPQQHVAEGSYSQRPEEENVHDPAWRAAVRSSKLRQPHYNTLAQVCISADTDC